MADRLIDQFLDGCPTNSVKNTVMSNDLRNERRAEPDAGELARSIEARWNGEPGRHWVDGVDHFDTLLDPMGAAVLAAARLQPGERVLEVGSGTGQLAMQASRLVAPDGSVVGVDLSQPMTDLARTRAAEAAITNLELVVADAAIVNLPESHFDALLSRFGVMFFADPAAAFSHLVSRLRPGGRLAVVVWQERSESDLFALPAAVVARLVPDAAPTPAPGMPGMFALSDPSAIRRLLLDAGATDVLVESHRRLLTAGPTVTETVAFMKSSSGFEPVLAAGPELVEAAEEELRRLVADHMGPTGVELGGAAWLVTARRPS